MDKRKKVPAAEWVRCLLLARVTTNCAVGLVGGLAEGLKEARVTPEEAAKWAPQLEAHERMILASGGSVAPELAKIYRDAAEDLRERHQREIYTDPFDVGILKFSQPDSAPW